MSSLKVIDISNLDNENFNPIFINALRQYWKTTKSFQCMGAPKKQNLFLYVDGCKITYTDKTGNTFEAGSTDVVYTPYGSEYRAVLSDFQSTSSHTVGINFHLYDEFGSPFILSDSIHIFHTKDPFTVSSLFDKAAIDYCGYSTVSTRIVLMQILSELMEEIPCQNVSVISQAIRYLSKNIEKNPSVADLAKMCNVSEVYFRRKFKESLGISPAKYKNDLRLNKAMAYLEFGDIAIQEISETLGYSTVSHFIKEFKKHFGFSPLKYRKNVIDIK